MKEGGQFKVSFRKSSSTLIFETIVRNIQVGAGRHSESVFGKALKGLRIRGQILNMEY